MSKMAYIIVELVEAVIVHRQICTSISCNLISSSISCKSYTRNIVHIHIIKYINDILLVCDCSREVVLNKCVLCTECCNLVSTVVIDGIRESGETITEIINGISGSSSQCIYLILQEGDLSIIVRLNIQKMLRLDSLKFSLSISGQCAYVSSSSCVCDVQKSSSGRRQLVSVTFIVSCGIV